MTSVQQLFVGIGAVLVLATLMGRVLAVRRRGPDGAVPPVISNLNARIDAWWIMVLVIGGAFWIGRMAVIVLFGLLSFLCLREFVTLTATRRADHTALLVSFFLIVPGQYFFVAEQEYGMMAIFVPVYAFLLLPALQALASDATDFLSRTANLQWGLMVAVYCLSHVPALLMLELPGGLEPSHLVLFLLLVVQASDVLQYIWGKLLGRRRIAPDISPGKTVEGFVGGIVSASALGGALHWLTPFGWVEAGLLTMLVTTVGFLGGLVLSAIKRDRGVKDWGDMITGHGGVLDRLDSTCFAAPIFFHVVRFVVGG